MVVVGMKISSIKIKHQKKYQVSKEYYSELWNIIYPWLWWGWQRKTDDRMRWQQWQCWQGGERNVTNIKPKTKTKTKTETKTKTKKEKDTNRCVGNAGNWRKRQLRNVRNIKPKTNTKTMTKTKGLQKQIKKS